MNTAPHELPLSLLSPGKRVRAEVSVETVWIGRTVCPECPVWRVWYDGRQVVETSTAGLSTADGPLAYGLRLVGATRHRPQTGLGPGRELRARFADRGGRTLELRLRVTELSAFCALREVGRKRAAACAADLSNLRFPEGSVALGDAPASDEAPRVRFAPSGKLVASWRHGLERHLVFFDRPGDLAARRFGALRELERLEVTDGRRGCDLLFLAVPFTKAPLPAPVFGAALTPAYRAAFELLLGRGAASDDLWVVRGEPGEFAVAARREGAVWRVGGVTAAAQTLTVRFEDLWLRTPRELRSVRYTVEILRDPLKSEAGDRVEERFLDQAPDVRVALDAAAGGGFVLAFTPA